MNIKKEHEVLKDLIALKRAMLLEKGKCSILDLYNNKEKEQGPKKFRTMYIHGTKFYAK